MFEDLYLHSLQELQPLQPHYMIRVKLEGCKLMKDWNLMVPEEILNESWGEGRIQRQPNLAWKALNVRRYKGIR